MKIFVVTPYDRTDPAWLRQAHISVRGQTLPATHILVAEGGHAAEIPDFVGTHIVLNRHYDDRGTTARLIGCFNAMALGADAIAFLEPENWFMPGHLKALMDIAAASQLDAIASARMLHRLDGSPMMKCPVVDGRNAIDTSCLIVLRPAFRFLAGWVSRTGADVEQTDQFVWRDMRDSGARLGFLDQPSVAYRARHAVYYQMARETPPPGAIVPGAAMSPSRDTTQGWVQPAAAPEPLFNRPAAAMPLSAPPPPEPPLATPALFGGGIAEQHASLIEPLFNLPACLPASAWTGHIPFLFALFRMLRPACFVELGVQSGASLIAAATAATTYGLPTRLIGIDSFHGDEHTGHYDGEATYRELTAYLAATFPAVRLERGLFADLLPRHPPGSVDLLHIDGLHTYEAVREDFTSWFDRVSPAGVILLHDIAVHDRGFGVHLLWEDLKSRFTTLEFPHSHGLGVVLLAPNDERVRPLAALARDPRAMRAYQALVSEIARVLPERMAGAA